MRGGQITMFFVIGLVLLIAFGIFFYARMPPAEDIVDTGATAVLSSFLGSCVDTVVNEQLAFLGAGALDFAGYPSADVGGREVLYGVTRNRDIEGTGAVGPYAYPAPRYPEWGVSVLQSDMDADGTTLDDYQDGYFGDVNFPAVCAKNGPNRPGSTFTCLSYEGNPPGTPGPSTQELLTDRVLAGVRGCADLRAFREAIGEDVERVGDPGANITFTTESVLVTLSYPLVIGDSSHVETFRRDFKVRYLSLAQYALALSRAESRNVTFNITRDYRSVPEYRTGFTVTANRDVAIADPTPGLSGKATLVTIIDANSVIDGQAYSISFLIEHRPPMLSTLTVAQGGLVLEDGYLPDATLVAVDPDEGPVTVTIERDALGNLDKVTVTDADGDTDWQEF